MGWFDKVKFVDDDHIKRNCIKAQLREHEVLLTFWQNTD